METPQPTYMLYNNPMYMFQQNFGENVSTFTSPIIPHIQAPQGFGFRSVFTSIFHINSNQQLVDKMHWISDYSDDIFDTLREAELNRRFVCFRSQQVCQRTMLLQLLKSASRKCKLSRTTLHLAVYLLDCFMDSYTIRADKLNLSAIACLIIAAKIEEADVDMPKFADLNDIFDEVYTLKEFKNVERKVLGTFNFDVIRPTAATFAEYFSNNIITLEDYHIFTNHWNNEIIINNYNQQQQDMQTRNNFGNELLLNPSSFIVLSTPCQYSSYEHLLSTLCKTFFELIDVSLNYLKFANARPSIIASACIAAVRQIYGVLPVWTPYLIKLTHYTCDIISPFVEAILAIYRIHCNNEYLNILQVTPQTPLSSAGQTITLCDSPDSGILSGNDTKSTISDSENEDNYIVNTNNKSCNNVPFVESDDEEDEAYHCLEYPKRAKRSRIF